MIKNMQNNIIEINKKIIKKRNKLHNSIDKGLGEDAIYQASIELDVLIAEYLKNSFWMNCYNLQQIEITLDKVNFSKIEAQIFFSRLLFPSFYFDYIENNDVPKDLEGRITEYLLFIVDIYTYLRKKYAINEIKWLNKKI